MFQKNSQGVHSHIDCDQWEMILSIFFTSVRQNFDFSCGIKTSSSTLDCLFGELKIEKNVNGQNKYHLDAVIHTE